MKAETAYNVIQALPEKEQKRLLKMLGVNVQEKKPKKKQIITEQQSMEYLRKKLGIDKKSPA
jgi:hypothetical protein